jgi:hypothetical protein
MTAAGTLCFEPTREQLAFHHAERAREQALAKCDEIEGRIMLLVHEYAFALPEESRSDTCIEDICTGVARALEDARSAQ